MMSLLKGRFQHCFLLVVVILSLCQFSCAIYYSNKVSGKFPRQGKRGSLAISHLPRRKMNFLSQKDSNIWALKRFYSILEKRDFQNVDKSTRLSYF